MKLTRPIGAALLALAVLSFATVPASPLHKVPDGSIPILLSLNPTSPAAGQNVTVTVTLDSVSEDGDWVDIDTSNPSAFSSLPQEVYVEPGDSAAQFTATMSSSYSTSFTLEASCNGGEAQVAATAPSGN